MEFCPTFQELRELGTFIGKKQLLDRAEFNGYRNMVLRVEYIFMTILNQIQKIYLTKLILSKKQHFSANVSSLIKILK